MMTVEWSNEHMLRTIWILHVPVGDLQVYYGILKNITVKSIYRYQNTQTMSEHWKRETTSCQTWRNHPESCSSETVALA